jgi:Amt family ammonium transporter
MRVTLEEEEVGLDASQHNEKYLQGTLLVEHDGALKEEENEVEHTFHS